MATLGDYVTVTAADVAEGWRELTSGQVAAAETLIGRAAAILVTQSPGLLDRLDTQATPVEAVEQVLIQAVRRALLPLFNPDGAKSSTKSLEGEYSETLSWDTDTLARGLDFTARELQLVGAPARSGRGKAFSINTAPASSRDF